MLSHLPPFIHSQLFEPSAEVLREITGCTDSLQLCPSGIIELISPLTNNTKGIGLDILRDPYRRGTGLQAIETDSIVVGDPLGQLAWVLWTRREACMLA